MKGHFLLFIILLISQIACQPVLHSNTPTLTIPPTQTPIPRWVEYERALSKAVVHTDDGLCEWEILGKSGNEVYVWAECKVRELIGTASSVPAVIRLGENGEIENITIPRDGNLYVIDVNYLFPIEIQDMISHPTFDGPAAEKHIDERLITDGPPIIVIDSVQLP